MQYDPNIPAENKFTQEETLAYCLTCHWVKLRSDIFPDYRHQSLSSKLGDIRKTYLYKNIIKFVREKKSTFKGFQYVLFMRAQLEILKRLQKKGYQIVVEANCLHGEAAQKRWYAWKKLVGEINNTSKIAYAVIESNIDIEFDKTKKSIDSILGDNVTFENYENNRGEILKYIILKKISDLYLICSKWFQKLPKEFVEEVYEIKSLAKYQDYNLTNVKKLYNNIFKYEN